MSRMSLNRKLWLALALVWLGVIGVGVLGAVEARNDFDVDGYGGPCPPPGKPHRYVVTVYALSIENLRLTQGRPAAMFDREIGTSTLGSATLTVTYGR